MHSMTRIMRMVVEVLVETGQVKPMKTIMVNRIRSTSGESIAETLVAVLIAAFALLMLAGTVNTSSNLITKSKNKIKEYNLENNKLEMHSADSKDGDGTASILEMHSADSKDGDGTASIDGGYSWIVTLYSNKVFSTKPVVSFGYDSLETVDSKNASSTFVDNSGGDDFLP